MVWWKHKYNENIWITGCSGRKKVKFYQRLFSLLISEWILALGDEANDDAITSKDKAVRWKFEQLDVNNNSVCLYSQPLILTKNYWIQYVLSNIRKASYHLRIIITLNCLITFSFKDWIWKQNREIKSFSDWNGKNGNHTELNYVCWIKFGNVGEIFCAFVIEMEISKLD